MIIILILILSGISAACYRLGGSGKRGNWLDFARNTRTRDAICPLIAISLYWCLKGFNLSFWWAYLLVFGISWGALSTYWDWLFNDVDNFYMHGFACGLAAFPLFWCGVHWWAIGLRAFACAILMGVWSKIWGWDIAEETGRGFIFVASIWLLVL